MIILHSAVFFKNSCLLPVEVLLLRGYPVLQLLSPFVTVEEILAVDELEESFGEVVKFLDGVVLDLLKKGIEH